MQTYVRGRGECTGRPSQQKRGRTRGVIHYADVQMDGVLR